MAEQVDATDLKSVAFERPGSSPGECTNLGDKVMFKLVKDILPTIELEDNLACEENQDSLNNVIQLSMAISLKRIADALEYLKRININD